SDVRDPRMRTYVTTVPAGGCPDRERLFEFDLGRLSEPELDAIASHLSWCDRCEASLKALRPRVAEDRDIVRLRNCWRGTPMPQEPAYAVMEAAAFDVGTMPDPSMSTVSTWKVAEGLPRPPRMESESHVMQV